MKELHISGTHAKNSVGWFYFSENSQILNVMYIRIIIPPNLQIVQMYLYVCYRECEWYLRLGIPICMLRYVIMSKCIYFHYVLFCQSVTEVNILFISIYLYI